MLHNMTRMLHGTACAALLAALAGAAPAAQPARFEDVVRNLRNPEPKVRLASVRLLRAAQYPEAIVPMAPLVNDPVDEIQLEAIAAELSFFLVEDVPAKRRLGFLLEVRNRGGARTAFDLGPLAVWPKAPPPEVISELLKAVDDENPRVRGEAIYAVGVIGDDLTAEQEAALIKALDHYDPAVREGAARVAGRLEIEGASEALIKTLNDSRTEVRLAAMSGLGALREERAVTALTEQLEFYKRGEGGWAALDALAQIAHPSSRPLFLERLTDRDPNLRRAAAEGLGRLGDPSGLSAIEPILNNETSNVARAALTFAAQKLGRNVVPRLVEFLTDRRTALQAQGYLFELGPAIERELLPSLQEPDEGIRAAVAEVLGELGGEASLAALQARLTDRDKEVVAAATRAIERIRMRQSP